MFLKQEASIDGRTAMLLAPMAHASASAEARMQYAPSCLSTHPLCADPHVTFCQAQVAKRMEPPTNADLYIQARRHKN